MSSLLLLTTADIISTNIAIGANTAVINTLNGVKEVYFFEEGIRSGGVGECFGSLIAESGLNIKFKHICVNDEFIRQASVESQMKAYKLDKDSIVKTVNR